MSMQLRRRPDATPVAGVASPLLARLYASRGVQTSMELERGARALVSPQLLMRAEQAAARIAEAIVNGERICIVGDFDADGATSTALCVLALRAMGAAHVQYLVPNRFEYGYGLSPEIVADAVAGGAQLLVTVDSGISCHAGVHAAKAAGLAVIVTDHHLPGPQLPPADIIVNPNQPECPFPSKALAGVGVAFYVMSAVRAVLRERGYFSAPGVAEPAMADFLDLVALGTVADVVTLDAHNRVLVHQGLQRIRARRCRPGISALVTVAKRRQASLTATDLGFALGPRLNAAGRLDDMSQGIRLLLCDDEARALDLAAQLDDLNRERRDIEQGMKAEALAHLAAFEAEGEVPHGICLYRPDWHQGVIGILAGRLKERFYRPAVVFAPGGSDDELKGSARSVDGIHMRDLLESIHSQQPQLITRFGGHAMAAGLVLPRDHFQAFAAAFDAAVRQRATPESLNGVIWSDGPLTASELTLDTAALLRDAGPWGQGFPEPLFDGEFELRQQRLVGTQHLKMTVSPDGRQEFDAIAFNIDVRAWPNPQAKRVRLAYQLDINEFRGVTSVQLRVSHLWPLT